MFEVDCHQRCAKTNQKQIKSRSFFRKEITHITRTVFEKFNYNNDDFTQVFFTASLLFAYDRIKKIFTHRFHCNVIAFGITSRLHDTGSTSGNA